MLLISGLSDDQVALLGCLGALVVCGGMMSLSYYLRPRADRQESSPPTLKFVPRQSKTIEPSDEESYRRAA